jgi:hypothetical protein
LVAGVEQERRGRDRVLLAVPIRVRPADAPWPEETMTIDLNDGGVLFRSPRLYAPGDAVCVTLPYGRWADAGEVAGRVLRVQAVPGSNESRVAVALATPEKP